MNHAVGPDKKCLCDDAFGMVVSDFAEVTCPNCMVAVDKALEAGEAEIDRVGLTRLRWRTFTEIDGARVYLTPEQPNWTPAAQRLARTPAKRRSK